MYEVMSTMQSKSWSFETKAERDAKYNELSKDGFEVRKGIHKHNPETDLDENPYKGLIAKYGNCWF